MLKYNLKPLFIFLLVSASIILAAQWTFNSCNTLQYYRQSRDRELIPGFTGLLIKAGFLIVLVVLLAVLRKKRPQQFRRLKMPLAILLPFFIFHNAARSVSRHVRERTMIQSVCSKCYEPNEMKDLSLEEYTFVSTYLRQLPALPQTAKHIDTYYYGDGFLGEYLLLVHLQCHFTEIIPQNAHWYITKIDTAAGVKYISYENGAQ